MTTKNQAGKSTREMAKKRKRMLIWITLAGIALILVIYLLMENASALGIGGLGVLGLFFVLQLVPTMTEKQLNRKVKEHNRAIRGAKAEEKIGDLLAQLPSDFFILHDVESPYGNIDHLVISKSSGIFLLETKAHGGKVTTEGDTLLVNGKVPEKDFIAQALKNAYWLRDQVAQLTGAKPWITPVVVFTNAFVPRLQPIKGVRIINKKFLCPLLEQVGKVNPVNLTIWEQREVIRARLTRQRLPGR